MAVLSRRRKGHRAPLGAGPWKGVRTTRDPYDDSPNELVDAQNCYIPDPAGGSGMYARRGFDIANKNDPLTGRGQSVYTHIDLDGNTYNFLVAGGRLLRGNAGLTVFTDVTPVSGVAIDPDVTRVYFQSLTGELIVNDEVNTPWIVGTLGATPVTGTPIDFDGAGTPWSAYGRPAVYGGSLFFVINEVGGVKARTDIAWSAPGTPAVGYQQTDYDFRWTLMQTASNPIYAIWGTNVALFYFRDKSIGAIAGVPGPDLQQAATHDSVSVNVGCLQSATIAQWGNLIYFCDAQGRPYMMPLGSPPVPIWLNMRSVVDDSTSAYPAATAQVSCAVIEPTLNLYLAAIWSPTPGVADPPIEFYAFDAKTGTYVGRWDIAGNATIEAIGILNNNAGNANLVVIGNEPPAGGDGIILATEDGDYLATQDSEALGALDMTAERTGCIWAQNARIGDGIPITTEDDEFITTEDGETLTTENTIVSWKDDGRIPNRSATTQRLGYASDATWNVDQCTIIAGSPAPCAVTMQTPTTAGTLEGTPSPSTSQDTTYRLVVGANVQGRGVQVIVRPTTADEQWSLQSIGIIAIPALATAQDP